MGQSSLVNHITSAIALGVIAGSSIAFTEYTGPGDSLGAQIGQKTISNLRFSRLVADVDLKQQRGPDYSVVCNFLWLDYSASQFQGDCISSCRDGHGR